MCAFVMTSINYHPSLTGLRFFAALLVYLFHHTPVTNGTLVYDLIKEFHIGVSLFFTLSGFLICRQYHQSIVEGTLQLKHYFINRFAKIYPVYFLLTSITAIVNFEGWKTYLMNITLLKGFSETYWFTHITQGWSLTTEATFYLLAPFIFLLLGKFNLVWQALVLIVTGIAFTFLFGMFNNESKFFGSYHFTMVVTFFGRCVEFFAGVFLALFLKKGKQLPSIGISFTYLGLTLFLAVALALSLLEGNNISGLATISGVVVNNLVLPVFSFLLIYGLVVEQTLAGSLFASKLFQWAGKSSYCFYLLHLGVTFDFINLYLSTYLVVLFVVLVSSIVLYFLIEKPVAIYIRKCCLNNI